MKTKLIYIVCTLMAFQSYGQGKYAADRYFQEYAYKKSADLYTQLYKKGDSTQVVLERLGDSYYYNSDVRQAEIWYGKLVDNYESNISPEYLFRYAQALKGNGKYKASDAMLLKFYSLSKSESQEKYLLNNSNYVADYEKTNSLIHLHNVSTNTKYSDFGGFLQGKDYYFASTKPKSTTTERIYKWNNQPFLNLYKATSEEGTLDDASQGLELIESSLVSGTINTRYHEAAAIITKDGQTMYFTRDNYDGKRRGKDKNRETLLKLYKAHNINGSWENIEELPFNSDDYSTGHPALSNDEQTLYFVSDMPGGLGETDVYKVSITNNSYGTPINLGKEINTKEREMFPFITSEDVLYFSSDGHLGLGNLDIFETKIEKDGFSEVKNIKEPFNSPLDDFGFIINKEKNQGFFSSNREGGKGDDDIYSFIVSQKPPCVQDITGVVTDSNTHLILANATVKLLKEGEILKEVTSDANGKYSFLGVSCDSKYTILGEKVDYTSDQKEVITNLERDKINKADLVLKPLIIGGEIVINPIFFDFDKYNIREEAEYELEKIITVMNNHPDMVIKIESHTDSRGTKAYNRRLSDNRAKSTRNYITSRGIASNRIASAIGYGEGQLLNNCDDANQEICTEEDHQRNRRSKFIIVSGNDGVKVTDPSVAPLRKIDKKPGRN